MLSCPSYCKQCYNEPWGTYISFNSGFLEVYAQQWDVLGHMAVCLASLVAQSLKCLPAMRETWVRSLGWEDPLEKEMETHSSILAWRIPWMEEPGGLQSMGSQRVGHD